MDTRALVVLALIAAASAVPMKKRSINVDDDSCAQTCKDQPSKFKYAPDTTYIYDYKVDTDTTMAGSTKDSAKLSIQARAEIQTIDTCEFALKIKDVRISHSDAYTTELKSSDREDEFKVALQEHMLRFSFDDGIIASVCPNEDESTWVLNFKKGLLSAFQNSMDSFEKDQKMSETDITGECTADYSVAKSWGAWKDTTVKKSKNLVACSKRDGYTSFYQTISYNVPSEIQSLPIMQGTHTCDYIVNSDKVLKMVSCEENHIFAPFSNKESGGRTKVQQKLTLITQKSGIDMNKDTVQTRSSLLFEHFGNDDQSNNARESAQQTLKEICDQTKDDLRPETPRLFSQLVKVMKALKSTELGDLHTQLKNKNLCPDNGRAIKFFTDALPMTETSASVELMSNLIKAGDVKGVLAKAWLASLALIQTPTSEMITSITPLLDDNYYNDAVMPITALVNNYCKKVPTCGDDYNMGAITQKINEKLPRNCAVKERDLSLVMKTLRAAGNLGKTGDVNLATCLKAKSAPVEVRSAAAEAFRNFPCDSKANDDLWAILNDQSEVSEVRIFSYLSVMRCPTKDNLDKIAQLLQNENDDQVGSYISSHLTNLKQTSDPHKQEVAAAISKLSFKSFDLSALKYSKNFEGSFLINKLNLGLVAGADVILSSESPIPRYAKANLTVELFGNSINIFEAGGRVEGLEALIEKVLGSTGYFPNNNKATGKLNDVKGFAYARMFGNELFFEHAKGAESLFKSGKTPNFLDILIKLANRQEVAYTHSQKLMDVSLVIPTIAGLPLNIVVNGSINFDLKAEGKADLRQVSTSPRSLLIEGEFKPSAALEITGTMSVDAFVAKLGLRMRNTMHSSTGIKGRIEINRGRELSVEIDPPRDNMEIFNAKSQFFIVHNEIEKEQEMIKTNRKVYKYCTGKKMATILGVEFCGEIQFPNASAISDAPYFPLTGPSSISIVSYRRDTHTIYKLFAKRVENQKNSIAQFLMNTPGSTIDRMISADLTIGYSPLQLDVNVVSPWKKINLNSGVVMNKDLYSLVGSVMLDDANKYGVASEVKINKRGNSRVFTPLIELTNKGKTQTLLSGEVEIDQIKKVHVDLTMSGYMVPYNFKADLMNLENEKRLTSSFSSGEKENYFVNIGTIINGKKGSSIQVTPEVTVKVSDKTVVSFTGAGEYRPDKVISGSVSLVALKYKPTNVTFKYTTSKKDKYIFDGKVTSPFITGGINMVNSIQRKNLLTSTIKANYNIPKVGKDSITLVSKFNDKNPRFIVTSDLSMAQNKDYNTNVKVEFGHKNKYSDASVEVKYGSDPNDSKKKLTLTYNFAKKALSLRDTDIDFSIGAQLPEKNWDTSLQVSHSHSPINVDSSLSLKLTPVLKKPIIVKIKGEKPKQKLMSYTGEATLNAEGRKYAVTTGFVQNTDKQYQHTLEYSDNGKPKHTMKTVYTLQSNNHDLRSDINLDGFKLIQIQCNGSLDIRSQNFRTAFDARYGDDVYGAMVQSKYAPQVMRKVNLELTYPTRQIKAEAEGKYKDKYDGSISLDWDAGRNTKSQVEISGSFKNTERKTDQSINANVNLKTPFSGYEDLGANVFFSSDPSKYNAGGKFISLGKPKFTSNVNIERPFSFNSAKATVTVSTANKSFKEFDFELNHKYDSSLMTVITGKRNNDQVAMTLVGEDNSDDYNNDLSAKFELKSSIQAIKDVKINLAHKNNDNSYVTSAALTHNNNKYDAGIEVNHNSNDGDVSNDGNIKVSWPKDSFETTWKHATSGYKNIRSSMTSKWNRGKTMVVSIEGSNNAGLVSGKVVLQSPFEQYRNMELNFNHNLGGKRFDSSASFKKNKVETAVYNVNLEPGNVKFYIITPFYQHKVDGQATYKMGGFLNPLSVSTWLQWKPWARVDFDGYLGLESSDNIEMRIKLTTPFEALANIAVQATHKLEDSEYTTYTLIDYDVDKKIEFENKLNIDDMQIRTKMNTPCPYFKSLNYGAMLEMDDGSVKASADFELLPMVKKYDTVFAVEYGNGEHRSKFNLNTPHTALPSVEITSWKKIQEDGSTSVQFKVSSPTYGVYSYDETYKFDLPMYMEVTLKTPHAKLETAGMKFSFNSQNKNVQSKWRANLNKQEMTSELTMDWSKNVEVSFSLNTPFQNLRNNIFTLKHDTSKKGFNSRTETRIGNFRAQGEAAFSSSSDTATGNTRLTITGYDKFEGSFKLLGNINNVVGDASVKLGAKAVKVSFTNNMSPSTYKSSFELNTPYTDDLKLSFGHETKSTYPERSCETKFEGSYGDDNVVGKLSVNYAGMKKGEVEFTLTTTAENFKSTIINLSHDCRSDKVSAKAEIKSSVEKIGNIELNLSKKGFLSNMVAMAKLARNKESLIDTQVETSSPSDEIHGKVAAKGKWMPGFTAQVDHKGGYSNYNTKTKLSTSNGNVIESEVNIKAEDDVIDYSATVSYTLDSESHTHTLTIHKEGEAKNMKLSMRALSDGEEVKGHFELMTDSKYRSVLQIENFFNYDLVGYEIEQSGDLDKFDTFFKINFSKDKAIVAKTMFYRYSNQRIELKAELTTPFSDYRSTKFEYRHEGQSNRLSCSVNLNQNDKVYSSDLIIQKAPIKSLAFNVKTPVRGYEEIIISGDYDSKRINARANLGNGVEFTLTGITGAKYRLTTSFDNLKEVTIDMNGELLDGSVNFIITSRSNKIEGQGMLQYTSPNSMKIFAAIDSNNRNYQKYSLTLENSEDEYQGKKSHFEVEVGQSKPIVLDGRYLTKQSIRASKQEHQAELKMNLPYHVFKDVSINIDHSFEKGKVFSKLLLDVNSNTLFDGDFKYTLGQKHETALNIRKPVPMEHTVTILHNAKTSELEIYLNWDKNDPTQKINILTSMKNNPNSYATDRQLSFSVVHPSRSVGVEQSLFNSANKLKSSGKVYWSNDDSAKVSYTANIDSDDESYKGQFKLGLPTRTLGLTGSLSNKMLVKADGSFSWDVDRDESKQIGVAASISGKDFTKTDITVQLPADLKVNSALILNQGNTIFDSKTAISYKNDKSKTLTLFSTLKNRPTPTGRFFRAESQNSFNYSIELGVQHIESKVDVKIDGHLASSDELLTSSMGVAYLTSRRQLKNTVLFAEINKLKKQINLISSNPYNSFGVSGKILNDEPLNLEVSGSFNGQERVKSTLDTSDRSMKIVIGQPENLISFTAEYVNATAVQVAIDQMNDNDDKPEATLTMNLASPQSLYTTMYWAPELVSEVRSTLAQQTREISKAVTDFIRQVNMDIRTEVSLKYREIANRAIAVDLKEIMDSAEETFDNFANEIEPVMNAYKFRKTFYESKTSGKKVFEVIQNMINQVKQYPLASEYNRAVTVGLESTLRSVEKLVSYLADSFENADLESLNPEKQIAYLQNTLQYYRSRIDNFRKQFKEFTYDNFEELPYIAISTDDMNTIQNYLANVKETVDNNVPDMFQSYYDSYNLKENARKEVKRLFTLAKDIIEDEMLEYLDNLKSAMANPVVTFDPKNGRVELNIPLYRVPSSASNVSSNLYNNLVASYTDNLETIKKYYPWNNEESNDVDDLKVILADFEPISDL
ncbi:uncharacterized protein LOC131930369 isoform X2 [Physella acuta]|uniref:uncharacterized protein LOC131930369 isoform X2 n=1 Tax=Physella acuta TaxID=109671 RepID=UPI0027DB06B4|nr:uncharacterized protein LOC131930369 isoform X2 [Physella acuta]